MKKRIIFMGTPEFAVPVLEALIKSDYNVIAVYTPPDKRVGRGKDIVFSPVKKVALLHGLEIVQPDGLKEVHIIDQLESFSPELIVVAAYGYILPLPVLDIPEFGCLNVHPSLLPKYRGASPVATAIMEGDQLTGTTIMLMDSGLDTGPIVGQRNMPIHENDTTGSLTASLAKTSGQLLVETMELWFEGTIKPRPQDESQATYTEVITKESGRLDWGLSAVQLSRIIRAYSPWPGSYTTWKGKLLRIEQSLPLPDGVSGKPGTVTRIQISGKPVIGVHTGDGVLGLIVVQLEGKKALSTEEFIRGQRDFIGSTLI